MSSIPRDFRRIYLDLPKGIYQSLDEILSADETLIPFRSHGQLIIAVLERSLDGGLLRLLLDLVQGLKAGKVRS